LFIRGYRNVNDTRYYVPVIIKSEDFPRIKLDFLMDTGATRTQIGWKDAFLVGIKIRELPKEESPYISMGGAVDAYILEQCTLIFSTNLGKFDIPIDKLSVSDYMTTDSRPCPILPSVIGIDILTTFDILFEGAYAYLRRTTAKVTI
jgi:hypothetical protein